MRQVLVGLVSVAFLLSGVTMITPLGSEAKAGGYSKKYTKKYYKPKRVSHKDLAKDHEKLGEWIEKGKGFLF